MKKKLFFAAIALTTLAGCTDESYVGDQSLLTNDGGAISFNMKTPAITRSEGSTAAGLLNNNFVFFGYKTMSDDSKQNVFENYQANYVANTAKTTTSNSADWEYVGYKRLHADMTNQLGVAANATGVEYDQTIKYWDYSASNYKFYAYSLGAGKTSVTPTLYANASLMSNSDTYTLQGDQEQLSACYISELKTIVPTSTTPTEVELSFLSIMSKLQLGFYETIPGYSVKELKFYVDQNAATAGTTPSLYQIFTAPSTATLPKAGTYTIAFDSNGKPVLNWAAAATDGTQANVTFDETLTNYADKDYQEAADINTYLGRTSKDATLTEVKKVLPYATGSDLNLKVDYVLVSRDGSGETIKAKGATAIIPAAYTQWKPNYKYTYLFKISDNSNPLIGGVEGLYPITLDAVVTDTQDGSQETITTVDDPSITTYAKGTMVTANIEYLTGANIYIVVGNGSTALTVGTSANLYIAEIEDGAAQGITEATVKNAIAQNTDGGYDFGEVLKSGTSLTDYYTYDGSTYTEATGTADGTTTYYKKVAYSVKDANGKKLIIKTASGLSAITQIEAEDAPDGKVINDINGAKFTPAVPTFTALSDGTLTAGKTYYTYNSTTEEYTKYVATGGEAYTGYYEKTASTAGYYVFEYIQDSTHKYYKVIKVVDKY